MSKKIGLDIDGTVTDPGAFIPYLNEHFNKNITLDDITDYDLTKLLNISKEQFWKWMEKNEASVYEKSTCANDAQHVIKNWQKKHELIYISARGKHLLELTKKWFAEKDIPYDHIELIGKHDKLDAIKKYNIDIFFEDKHDNACNIAEECQIPVILMDTPYNRLPTPPNVIRVKNWQEAKARVNKWFQESSF